VLHDWSRALDSPVVTLARLKDWIEPRLSAHVDGLVVAGEPAIERLLQPELSAPEEPTVERAAMAAAALLGTGKREGGLGGLFSAFPGVGRGVERASCLSSESGLDPWLGGRVGAPPREGGAPALLRIAAERGTAISSVLVPMQSQDPREAAAAAAAARF